MFWFNLLLYCVTFLWPCHFYATLYEPLVTLLLVSISSANMFYGRACILLTLSLLLLHCMTLYNTYMTLLWPCYFCCYIVWTICDLVISAANIIWPFFCSLVYDLLWTYCYCYSFFDLFVTLWFLLLIIWPFSCCSLYVHLWLCNFCCSFYDLVIFAVQCMIFKLCYFCCLLFDLVISAAHRMTSINFPIWKYITWVTFWYTNVHHLDKMFKLSNCIMI